MRMKSIHPRLQVLQCRTHHVLTKSVARAVSFDQPSVDVREMNPYLVMATLVSKLGAKNLMINFESAVTADVPFIFRSWWLDKSHASARSPRTPPVTLLDDVRVLSLAL